MSLKRLGQLKTSSDVIGNRNRDIPACSSIVPEPNTLPRAPVEHELCRNSIL
jgi:hypothetical protein